MKYIKKFERVERLVDINYGEDIYWTIYGKSIDYIKVLEKILEERVNFNHYYLRIENLIDVIMRNSQEFKNYQGIFLTSYSEGYDTPTINYRGFIDETDKNRYISLLEKHNTVFKGELKIVNDKLVLDSIEVDVKKYNL